MPDASGLLWRRPPSALGILGAVGGLPKFRRGWGSSIANGLLRPVRGDGVRERVCLMLRACYEGGPRVPSGFWGQWAAYPKSGGVEFRP